jgi:hypothetical protein
MNLASRKLKKEDEIGTTENTEKFSVVNAKPTLKEEEIQKVKIKSATERN